MTAERSFLPESLRPQPKATSRPKTRHRLRYTVVILSIATVVAVLASWRVDAVLVESCSAIPASATADFNIMQGRWVPAVDLDWVRRQAERWPGVATVDVKLQLPGTLRVLAGPEDICGTLRVGAGWRAVSCDGTMGRRLEKPQKPVLEGFESAHQEVRRALAVGRRLAQGGEAEVLGISRLTPTDYEVRLIAKEGSDQVFTVRVYPTARPTEEWWFSARAAGTAPAWADLRHPNRVISRGIE
ncbi:MAG: hypothetical protein K8R59_00155 [Thermoanaerobaculales bacterium]|nr:hypothetical protein [Thermoanaerobaculales bacterium]